MQNSKNYFENIDLYVINSAKFHALKIVERGYYPFYELDDLEQEILALFLYQSKKSPYEKTKSTYKYWVSITIENICKELIRKKIVHNKYFSKTSLNDFCFSDDNDSSEIIDLIEDKSANTFEEYYKLNQKEKLLNAIDKLPDELKDLCRMLQDKNVTEIAKELNLSRDTIYRKIHRIKEILEKEM